MSHNTKGNCHRQSGWFNLYIFGHNALNFLQTVMDIMPWTAYQRIAFHTWNCLQVLNTKHILYVQKKQLVSKRCPVVATPVHIHHHTSNHKLTIFLFVFMFCIQHSAAAVAADTFRNRWHVMSDLRAFIYLLYLNIYTTKAVQCLDKTVP